MVMPKSASTPHFSPRAESRKTTALAPRNLRRRSENPCVPSTTTPSSLARCRPIAGRHAALAFALGAMICAARADCIDDAANRHQVNAAVLRAIGWQESRLQPAAFSRNADGSVDLGAFQINSVHLPELARYGLDRTALSDGCICADVAAWHYRRQVERLGDGWQAVGAYHSRTPARAAWYANRIAALLIGWHAMPAGPLPFPPERTLAPGWARPDPAPVTRIPAARPVPAVRQSVARFDEIAYVPPAH